MLDKILVPLDGSPLAACVLPHVVAITQAFGSNLTLLRILETDNDPDGAVNPMDWQLRKLEAQSSLKTCGERLASGMAQPLMLLFTPPFDKTAHDPGYIKGYLPGIRENGGQYTHAALWAIWLRRFSS